MSSIYNFDCIIFI